MHGAVVPFYAKQLTKKCLNFDDVNLKHGDCGECYNNSMCKASSFKQYQILSVVQPQMGWNSRRLAAHEIQTSRYVKYSSYEGYMYRMYYAIIQHHCINYILVMVSGI